MKHLNNFNEYISEGLSKNHPIQELRQKDKLGIVLLGAPGSGKSTFAKEVIMPQVRNIKIFSTDDVSLMYTKDPNVYKVGSAKLNIERLRNYLTTGQNFIYDTTGANEGAVFEICKDATKLGYKIVFILILIDLPTAKSQNLMRSLTGGHNVDEDYIEYVYQTQNQTTKNYMKYLKPESFYIVLNKQGKYKYFKHLGNKLLKRKVDKYVPVTESIDSDICFQIQHDDYMDWRNRVKTDPIDKKIEQSFKAQVINLSEEFLTDGFNDRLFRQDDYGRVIYGDSPSLGPKGPSLNVQLSYCGDEWYLVEIYFNWVFYTFLCDGILGVDNLAETFIEDWNSSKSHWYFESKEQELLDELKKVQRGMRGLIRTGLPVENYEDYFLELKESENFRVRIDKGHGYITNIEINGMLDKSNVEPEFNRILTKMKMIKNRLEKQFGFDCHFMIWINGQSQQDLNPQTHRNDDYKFKGVGERMNGYDKDYYYTTDVRTWDHYSRPYPEDKASIQIKFMIV